MLILVIIIRLNVGIESDVECVYIEKTTNKNRREIEKNSDWLGVDRC